MKQFRIRDLLALIVICALVFGWWTDRRQMKSELRRERLSRLGFQMLVEGYESRFLPIEERHNFPAPEPLSFWPD